MSCPYVFCQAYKFASVCIEAKIQASSYSRFQLEPAWAFYWRELHGV